MRVTILALLGAFGLVSTAAGQPYPDADSPSGGALILAVWDDVANVSLVWALPALTYQDLRDRRLGLFNEPVPGLAATFAGSDAANIQYTVLAAGLYAPGFPETPQPALFATVPGNSSFASVLNTNVLGAYIAITSFYDALQNECASRNPCSTTDPQSGVFAARLLDVGLQLPFPVATSFGSSLRFFDIAQTGFRDNTLPPQFPRYFRAMSPLPAYATEPVPAGF